MPSAVTGAIFPPLKGTALFQPLKIGRWKLNHRIVLAPLTRARGRAEKKGVHIPTDLAVEYYTQRATEGGLLISEGTEIRQHAIGFLGVPGIFTQSQIEEWKKVTSAVHAKGGYILCQLWHGGRATPASWRDGTPAPSSSNIPISGNALDGSPFGDVPPYAMSIDEIHEMAEEFGKAAVRAIEAGFDGVEIHGANGYLLEQFLHDNVNNRTDEYGGSVENRCRFPLEVIQAVSAAVGADRVGIRLSPYNYYNDTKDSNPNQTWMHLCAKIAQLPEKIAYVHMVEPRTDGILDEKAKLEALASYTSHKTNGNIVIDGVTIAPAATTEAANSLVPFRKVLQQTGISFLAAGGYTQENCEPPVSAGDTDGIVFGRWFISNPDLVYRLAEGLPLNKYDRSTFYRTYPLEHGYTDYPKWEGPIQA